MPITNPTDIANCEVWFHRGDWYTDAGVTLATNGQSVQQWNDSSGHARHATQATLGNRPTRVNSQLNGLDGIRCTRANSQDLGFNGAWMYNTGITIFTVVRRASAPGEEYFYGTNAFQSGNDSLHLGYFTGSTTLLADLGGNNEFITVGAFLTGEYWWRDCFRFGGPGGGALSRDVSRNGTALFTSTTDTSKLSSLTNATNARIGSSAGAFFDGWIFEVIGYSRVLTASEYADLDAWALAQGYIPPPPPVTDDLVTAGFLSAAQIIAAPHPADRVTAAFLSAGQTIAAPGAPPINDRVTAGFLSAGQIIAAPVPVDNDRVTAGWLSVGQVIPVPVLGKPYSYAFIIQ